MHSLHNPCANAHPTVVTYLLSCIHDSSAGTKWLPQVREVKEDAVSIARLRSCGMMMIGKAVMHELGMGTTGSNPHHGYNFLSSSFGLLYPLCSVAYCCLECHRCSYL